MRVRRAVDPQLGFLSRQGQLRYRVEQLIQQHQAKKLREQPIGNPFAMVLRQPRSKEKDGGS